MNKDHPINDDFNDFLDISELIKNELTHVELPESLKGSSLLSLIADVKQTNAVEEDDLIAPILVEKEDNVLEFSTKSKFTYKKWAPLAYAAAFVFVVGTVYTVSTQGNSIVFGDKNSTMPMASPANENVPAPFSLNSPSENSIEIPAQEPSTQASVESAPVPQTTIEGTPSQKTPIKEAPAAQSPQSADNGKSVSDKEVLPSPKNTDDLAQLFDKTYEKHRQYETMAPDSGIVYANPETGGGGMGSGSNDLSPSPPMAIPNTGGGGDASVKANPNTVGGRVDGTNLDFHQTNAQVEGVAESDIIKTDGKSIFRLSATNSGPYKVSIVDANSMKLKSEIKLSENKYPSEMYLSGNMLAIISTENEQNGRIYPMTDNELSSPSVSTAPGKRMVSDNKSYSCVDIYDISDSSNPKSVKSFSQSGYYNSSRVYNGTLYMISNYIVGYLPSFKDAVPYSFIPYTKSDLTYDILPLKNISISSSDNYSTYVVLSAVDLNGKTQTNTKAILGSNNQIYMSTENLYLTATSYKDYSSTDIIKVAVDKTNIDVVATGNVNGVIDDQFAMDEYKGNFRIATTSYGGNLSKNNLYILDSILNPLGKIENLAPGEKIYSARFTGDTGYIVTFKQIDPLFVLDLSDPKNPKVKGELKIPGYSEYMHPVDENTLIGFGVNTKLNANGGIMQDGLKLSMFDVTDPLNPKESHNFFIGNEGSYSPVLGDHKAFMYHPKKSLIGFPVTIYKTTQQTNRDRFSMSSDCAFEGYLVVEFNKETGFKIVAELPPATNSNYSIDRGLYIGENIYTSGYDTIRKYSMKNWEHIQSIKLPK